MKHLTNSLRSLDTKNPIHIISALSVIGGIAYILTRGSIIAWGAIWADGAGILAKLQEFLFYSFIHGGILHTLSNVIFFIYIGTYVQDHYGQRWIWKLWIWTTIFVGIVLSLFATVPTIGGSGFAMALMVAYTAIFYRAGNPQYRAGVGLIILNIVIGFYGQVSLLGHLSGAIAGWLFLQFKSKSNFTNLH